MRVAICIAALLLAGCGHRATSGDREPLAANLKEPCAEWPTLTAGTGKVVLPFITLTKSMYLECQSKHKRTVEAYETPTKETK